MEALGASLSPPPAAAAAVLDNDDLLCEVLLRVAFPTSLVRAALVCKRWLGLASAPAFLRRFRDLHPPRLLGFYVTTTARTSVSRFVPLPQPPELVDVVRRGSFDLDTLGCDRLDVDNCWNGLLLLTYSVSNQPSKTVRILRCPLYPARDTAILPPLPATSIPGGFTYDVDDSEVLSNGRSCFYLALGSKGQQTIVDVYVLQEDTWAICYSSVSEVRISLYLDSLVGEDKIYGVACVGETWKLFLVDLVSSSHSLVNLPEEVNWLSTLLSIADDSGVHLTYIKDFQIRIWLYRMDNNGVANWFLVNTISLRQICTNNMIPSRVFEEEKELIFLAAVGENAEFVLLEKDGVIYMFDLECKVVNKVYEAPEGECVYIDSPFMMVWPPKFPAIMEGCDPK